tara:strand:+ start:150 stop:521 length:372 start_codon:yes stop_codon:yes gene_type:complete
MATLRVTSLRGRTAGTSPELPDGAVVTGVTTTGSAIVGAAVTINATGVDAGAGIITATSFTGNLTGNVVGNVTGSATTIAGAPNVTLGNVNAGVVTATSYEGSGALLTGLPAGFTELDAALFN